MKTQGATKDVVFLSGVRTGFGTFGGSLKDLSAIDLGAAASRHAIQRSGVPVSDFGHTVFGNALQTSADAIYMARHVGLKAGLPIETPAVTVNRLCGSGFEAITQGAQLILLGEADAVLAGGAESMSQAPHVVRGARWGLRLGPAPLEDLLWESLKDPQCGLSMAETAESLAEKYKLTRKEVDEIAVASQRRAKQAWDACAFQDEVIPVTIKVKGKEVVFQLGYSHPVRFAIPNGIDIVVDAKTGHITITGIDKQKVGQTAAEIRSLREPDPYKGKGIKYTDEVIRRKAGKAGGK